MAWRHSAACACSVSEGASGESVPATRSKPFMMNGNFWFVVMTIRVPSTSACASCCESSSIAFTTPWACSIW